MIPLRIVLASCVALIMCLTAASAVEPPDLTKIDRHIAREPAYHSSRPLYGLYVFGPQAKTRVWAVLDQSGPRSATYDILYFDRNADGDLTAPEERIVGKLQSGRMEFDIGSFIDPADGKTHTQLRITRDDAGSVMLHVNWQRQLHVAGGYAPRSGPYTNFASSPGDAPILWPGAEAPLTFQLWEAHPLTIGKGGDVSVFIGHRGLGPNTFFAVPQDFLPPNVPVLATLIYTDKAGKERLAQSELRERC